MDGIGMWGVSCPSADLIHASFDLCMSGMHDSSTNGCGASFRGSAIP